MKWKIFKENKLFTVIAGNITESRNCTAEVNSCTTQHDALPRGVYRCLVGFGFFFPINKQMRDIDLLALLLEERAKADPYISSLNESSHLSKIYLIVLLTLI